MPEEDKNISEMSDRVDAAVGTARGVEALLQAMRRANEIIAHLQRRAAEVEPPPNSRTTS
jgi:hypothetical protein